MRFHHLEAFLDQNIQAAWLWHFPLDIKSNFVFNLSPWTIRRCFVLRAAESSSTYKKRSCIHHATTTTQTKFIFSSTSTSENTEQKTKLDSTQGKITFAVERPVDKEFSLGSYGEVYIECFCILIVSSSRYSSWEVSFEDCFKVLPRTQVALAQRQEWNPKFNSTHVSD